jgi:hypothetical protein
MVYLPLFLPLDCDRQRRDRPAEGGNCQSAALAAASQDILFVFFPFLKKAVKFRGATFCNSRRGRYDAAMLRKAFHSGVYCRFGRGSRLRLTRRKPPLSGPGAARSGVRQAASWGQGEVASENGEIV